MFAFLRVSSSCGRPCHRSSSKRTPPEWLRGDGWLCWRGIDEWRMTMMEHGTDIFRAFSPNTTSSGFIGAVLETRIFVQCIVDCWGRGASEWQFPRWSVCLLQVRPHPSNNTQNSGGGGGYMPGRKNTHQSILLSCPTFGGTIWHPTTRTNLLSRDPTFGGVPLRITHLGIQA